MFGCFCNALLWLKVAAMHLQAVWTARMREKYSDSWRFINRRRRQHSYVWGFPCVLWTQVQQMWCHSCRFTDVSDGHAAGSDRSHCNFICTHTLQRLFLPCNTWSSEEDCNESSTSGTRKWSQGCNDVTVEHATTNTASVKSRRRHH